MRLHMVGDHDVATGSAVKKVAFKKTAGAKTRKK
jgi:hypothetical protein